MMATSKPNNKVTCGKNVSDSMLASNPAIAINVILGMPSKNCQFHGICRIEPLSNSGVEKVSRSNQAKGILRANGRKELEILFEKKSFTSKMYTYHFGSGFFLIVEPIDMPKFSSRVLGERFKILPGKYPIENMDLFYSVNFSNRRRAALHE